VPTRAQRSCRSTFCPFEQPFGRNDFKRRVTPQIEWLALKNDADAVVHLDADVDGVSVPGVRIILPGGLLDDLASS
jgi:hypothetical protein